jgi:hypothetical protein
MTKMTILFFVLSILSFSASIQFLVATKKPGVYPPKYILKRRSGTMAIGAVVFLFIGFLLNLFH